MIVLNLQRTVLEFFLVLSFLYSLALAAGGSAILFNHYTEGQPLEVTCNADVSLVDPELRLIVKVILYRVMDDPAKTSEVVTIQIRQVGVEPSIYKNQDFLDDGWLIMTPKMESLDKMVTKYSDTRELMSVRIVNKFGRCRDQGQYGCFLYYDKDGVQRFPEVGVLKYIADGIDQIDSLRTIPDRPLGDNKAVFGQDEKALLICEAKGPKSSRIEWRWRCPYATSPIVMREQGLPKLKHMDRDGGDSACGTFLVRSAVWFRTVHQLRSCVVSCVFGTRDATSQRKDHQDAVVLVIDDKKVDAFTSYLDDAEDNAEEKFVEEDDGVVAGVDRLTVLGICCIILLLVFVPLLVLGVYYFIRLVRKKRPDAIDGQAVEVEPEVYEEEVE